MKITCGLPSDSLIEPLVKLGVREFYFGFTPSFWKRKYTIWLNSINRRYSPDEQLTNLKTLAALIRKYRSSVKFFVAFNNTLYSSEHIIKLIKVVRKLKKMGVAGVIASDIGFIIALKKAMPGIVVHLSSLGVCLNAKTAEFYKRLGISRVILPRSLEPRMVSRIMSDKHGMEFETFDHPTSCLNIDGFCTHNHYLVNKVPCRAYEHRYLRENETLRESFDNIRRISEMHAIGVDYMKLPRISGNHKDYLKKYLKIIMLVRKLNGLRNRT